MSMCFEDDIKYRGENYLSVYELNDDLLPRSHSSSDIFPILRHTYNNLAI